MIRTIDPSAQLGHKQIDLASLPDGFDEQTTLQWYIAQLAISFGVDYQEFAPLPGGTLGSSQQSEVLHLKSRGKGPAMGIAIMEHVLNNAGVLPKNVVFQYIVSDPRVDAERASARFERGKDRALRVSSGELDITGARRQAVIDGDLSEDVMEDMNTRSEESDSEETPDLTVDQVTGGSESHDERE